MSFQPAPPSTPTVPPLPITDEEWVAASQACCGLEPADDEREEQRRRNRELPQ